MGDIIEASSIPEDTKVYLKEDLFGWRVVEPLRDENGKFIWRNFFNPRGFVLLFFILLFLGICYLAFKETINNYRELINHPCKYCIDCYQNKILPFNSTQ